MHILCMSYLYYVTRHTWRGPCPVFVFKPAISVGNINTAESLQKKTENNLLAAKKGLHYTWARKLSGLYFYF